jgi:hypothetical protein
MIDGGWTAQGIRAYSKSLEQKFAALSDAVELVGYVSFEIDGYKFREDEPRGPFKDQWKPVYFAAPTPERAEKSAKQQYDASGCAEEEPDPIERLRFFCSLAMNGQDWIDVEPFFDAITPERADAAPTPSDKQGVLPGGNGYPDAMVIKSDPCACCGGCGCFACLKNNPASQERADAGKDSALTDEQIRAVADQHLHWGKVTYVNANLNSIVAFARAILAAKEKK